MTFAFNKAQGKHGLLFIIEEGEGLLYFSNLLLALHVLFGTVGIIREVVGEFCRRPSVTSPSIIDNAGRSNPI